VKLNLALRELHRAESALAADLTKLADRHQAEHEIHHVALDLADWSRQHVHDLSTAAQRRDVRLSDHARRAFPLSGMRRRLSTLLGRHPQPGLLLLADLRHLHRVAAGVSVDWELLAQAAQATKDTDLLAVTQRCHPQTLRQLRWANAMLKTLSPQVLAG
jgi:hypothetical protein